MLMRMPLTTHQHPPTCPSAQTPTQGSPIVMLLSGGYTRASAGVIIDSITNLHETLLQPQQKQLAAQEQQQQ